MTDELYINNIKADLGTSDISLKYNSNLLTDISKIVSNNSYTIRLPKTANNLRIIECVHIPSSTSRFPYIVHAGRLIRDGIIIIDGADVVLLAVSEGIEIALTWGNVNNFTPSLDKSLRELPYTEVEYVIWEKPATPDKTFPDISYGFKKDEAKVNLHPVATVKWIMDKIAASLKVTFDLPTDRMAELEEMFVPCLERNDSEVNAIANTLLLSPFKMTVAPLFTLNFNVLSGGTDYCFIKDNSILTAKERSINVTVRGRISFDVISSKKPLKTSIYIRSNDALPIPYGKINGVIKEIAENRYNYSYFTEGLEMELEPNTELEFTVDDLEGRKLEDFIFSPLYDEVGSFSVKAKAKEISLGDKYFIVPNLPDISQLNFLKAVTNMLGLFAVPTSAGEIKFVSFDMLENNKPIAVDWSNLILDKHKNSLPSEMNFTLDNMAKINRFKYNEDDEGVNDEAAITIKNENLEYERTVIELPFSATKTRNGKAEIRLYSYNGEELKTNSVSPRILRYEDNRGVFTGLSWKVLLDKYYQSYKELISNAKQITELVRLNAVELKNLDLSVPVYLKQYGSYFAIVTLKTKNDDICEVKLLKM